MWCKLMVATIYTTVGKQIVVDRFDGVGTGTNYYIGWGTGGSSTGGTATQGDTALGLAASEFRVLAVMSQPSADTNRAVATITTGTVKTIEEVGIFYATISGTATAGGSLIIRASHGGLTLASDDAVQYTIDLQQT